MPPKPVAHPNPVAMVTGASRGIGRATAIALAEAGFDVVISARTVEPGEQHHDIPLPGSLKETATEIEQRGREVYVLPMDMGLHDKMEAAWKQLMHDWGRVDVLVNNAIYQGQGTLDTVMDLRPVYLGRVFRGNVFSPVYLTQMAITHMRERGGGGRIINMVSGAAMRKPTRPVNGGGWSFAYAASKAAFQQLAGILKVELEGENIQVINLEPGLIITELLKARGLDESFAKQFGGAPPSVPAAVIAWLAKAPEAVEFNGETVSAQKFALERGLHGDWR